MPTLDHPPAPVVVERTASTAAVGAMALVRNLWTAVRYASLAMIGVTILVVGRQVYDVYGVAAGVHPVLGVAFLLVVAALLWIAVAKPLRKWLAVPVALAPPDMPADPAAATAHDLTRRVRFLQRLAVSLAQNPRLAGDARTAHGLSVQTLLAAARPELYRLREALRAPAVDLVRVRTEIAVVERDTFEAVLTPLDVEAARVIRAESFTVGVGTAISLNGTLDAWIVLWRSLNLVAQIATIYHGRPGVRGTLFVLRDVATAMFVAARAQGIASGAAGLLGSVAGTAGSVLLGPLADGALNAIVTLRIGYVAKARCRAFRVWRRESLADLVTGCFREATVQGRGVVKDVLREAGGRLGQAATDIVTKAKSIFAAIFGRGEPDPDF